MKGGVEAPRLITDNAYGALGNTLLKYSQDGLDYNQRQKQNDWNQAFQQQKLDYQKSQDAITNANTDRTFNYGVKRDNIKDEQWGKDFGLKKDSVVFDQSYKNKVFDHNAAQDNIKNNQWSQAFTNTVANQNKPDYTTFNGVDEQGNPILSMIDKNTGDVINTGQKIYQEPKRLSEEQAAYYDVRNQEIKDKRIADLEKSFRESNEFSNLNEQDQLKAIDTIRETGKLPQISYEKGMFGRGYYLPQNGSSNVDIKALENAINGL